MGFRPKRRKAWNWESRAIRMRLLADGWTRVDCDGPPIKIKSIQIFQPDGIAEFKNNGRGVFKRVER